MVWFNPRLLSLCFRDFGKFIPWISPLNPKLPSVHNHVSSSSTRLLRNTLISKITNTIIQTWDHFNLTVIHGLNLHSFGHAWDIWKSNSCQSFSQHVACVWALNSEDCCIYAFGACATRIHTVWLYWFSSFYVLFSWALGCLCSIWGCVKLTVQPEVSHLH